MPHFYRIKRWGSTRFGEPCRVLAGGRNGSILIEFEDGYRMVTTRHGVRRLVRGKTCG
uniref:Uncharacterized protein n=1 Tax=viral metagenome TaxID=1070528 RepID=A0A6H1ZCP7_9ZZZZ